MLVGSVTLVEEGETPRASEHSKMRSHKGLQYKQGFIPNTRPFGDGLTRGVAAHKKQYCIWNIILLQPNKQFIHINMV